MGWSIQSIGEKHVQLSDSTIIGALNLMELEIEAAPERFAAVAPYVTKMQSSAL